MPTFSAGVLQRNYNQGTIVVDMGLDIPDEALRRARSAQWHRAYATRSARRWRIIRRSIIASTPRPVRRS
jgi:hypothetical protein